MEKLLKKRDIFQRFVDFHLNSVHIYHDIHIFVKIGFYLVREVQLHFVQIIVKLQKNFEFSGFFLKNLVLKLAQFPRLSAENLEIERENFFEEILGNILVTLQ